MNTTKTIILCIAAFIALTIIILIIQVLFRKVKNKNTEDGRIKLSIGIWFASLFLSGSFITVKAIYIFSEAVDNIFKINPAKAVFESFKTGSLFIGLSIVYFLFLYLMVNTLSILIIEKRNDTNEINNNNYSYFLIKGILLIGFTICILPVFEIILRALIPSIQIPFYH